MKGINEPEVLRELWATKERAWKKVEHLGVREAIRKRLEDGKKAAESLGYQPTKDGKYLRKQKSARCAKS